MSDVALNVSPTPETLSGTAEKEPAPLRSWLAMAVEPAAQRTIDRVRRADDVARIAVMPDVHLAVDVCVGMAVATRTLVYPSAVGGDIGCGMLAVGFDADADLLRDPARAGRLLRAIGDAVPVHRRHRSATLPLPADLDPRELSHPSLVGVANDEGRRQLGTLGGGNHFIELQADGDGRLWLMIHSGSRAMGQVMKEHHLAGATHKSAGMMALDTSTDAGRAYLHDQAWAGRYADANRRAMAERVIAALHGEASVRADEASIIRCDHNHVTRETHFGQTLLVHRKGAMPADEGSSGVVPGSMGTLSYHVLGKGCADALRSSAHGAGRQLSRSAARERFTRSDLRRQMTGVWFDPRLHEALREESPRSYKDVRAVMRAQEELTAVVRTLRPLLVYKGG